MRELAIAGVWFFMAAGLFMIEPNVNADWLPYVARGKWVAIVLGVMNALRPVVKSAGMAFFRRIGWAPTPRESFDDEPPKPIVHPEFQITDDRIQERPPPDAFK